MFKANYHTHMKYCNHAEGDVADYVKAAINYGLIEFGMTDHGPILESFMSKADYERTWSYENMKLDMVDTYLNDIKECQNKYKNIRILSGFETEYLSGHDDFYRSLREKVDYLNLGVHFYEYDGKLIDVYNDVNYETIDGYLDTVKKAFKLGVYNTLVHPDLFLYNYKDKLGNNSFDEKCEHISKEIIKLCIENNVYVEINANGLKYSSDKFDRLKWKYPNVGFWNIAKDYKELKVLIGSDAHKPEDIYNDNVRSVIKYAEDLKIGLCELMEVNH